MLNILAVGAGGFLGAVCRSYEKWSYGRSIALCFTECIGRCSRDFCSRVFEY